MCPSAADEPRKRVPLLAEACRLIGARLVLSAPALDDAGALADAYREAWVCALPSISEAFGLTLARGAGVRDAGRRDRRRRHGRDRDDERIGRLFDGDDPQALAAALTEAMRLTDREACRARAEDFSLDRTLDAYEALYREIAA